MKHSRLPLAFLFLIAPLLVGCSMFSGGTVANDTPRRELVRQATELNQLARAAYAGVRLAHKVGAMSDARFVGLEPYVDAIEVARKEITAAAVAGDKTKFDAVVSALLAAMSELATAQIEAEARKPITRPSG